MSKERKKKTPSQLMTRCLLFALILKLNFVSTQSPSMKDEKISKLKNCNCISKRRILISTHTPIGRNMQPTQSLTAWSYYILGLIISQADYYAKL